MNKTLMRILAGSALATLLCANAAQAQDLPRTELKIVGSLSNVTSYKDFEYPFWSQTIPKKSQGAVMAQVKGFNEMGLKGPELMRLVSQGVVEYGTATMSYFSGDNPINEAIDLTGLAPDAPTARAITKAFEPVISQFYAGTGRVKVMGLSTNSAQVLFCNAPITGLQDIKGKKVRVGSRNMTEFIEALGGAGVTMPFGEVVPAMQNKVVDCAITGAISGYNAKWYEVSTHLYALPINWNQQIHAFNLAAWNKLDPKVQAFLQVQHDKLVADIWDAAIAQTQEGYDCNTGAEACPYPVKGKMKLVMPSDADRALLKKVLGDSVLPKWAARCSNDCVKSWNATVGQVLGLQAVK